MTQVANLLAALKEEQASLQSFVELLRQEQKMLTEGSIDGLLELAEKKSNHALKIYKVAEARHRLLQGLVSELTAQNIQNWLEKNSRESLGLWQSIRILGDQAQELNRINGELIQAKLRHNQQLLGALSRAVNQASLYGPNGQTSFPGGSGRSLGMG